MTVKTWLLPLFLKTLLQACASFVTFVVRWASFLAFRTVVTRRPGTDARTVVIYKQDMPAHCLAFCPRRSTQIDAATRQHENVCRLGERVPHFTALPHLWMTVFEPKGIRLLHLRAAEYFTYVCTNSTKWRHLRQIISTRLSAHMLKLRYSWTDCNKFWYRYNCWED